MIKNAISDLHDKKAKKKPKSQKKIRKSNALKKSQICGFWLRKSQYGNPTRTTILFVTKQRTVFIMPSKWMI